MYIPNHFREEDKQKIVAFMQQYNFGIVVNTKNGLPIATHLPFVIEERGDDVILTSHMAFANEQWKYFDGSEVLIIFSEPHAYISPKFYEKKQNVPTWNFVAVHCYGIPKFVEGDEAMLQLLEKTILSFEADYLNQFKELDEKYKMGSLHGIKGFEIVVNKIEGKYKLSQNKTEKERENIITAFEKTDDDNLRAIAELMKKK
ncbi:MAG: FMN-binding negative transcriptional regulator [Bacteroidia bacterium]